MFVIDPNAEVIAVREARRMGIPVVSVVDTNCDPDMVDWVIPGNDDALRAIRLFTTKISDAVVEGRRLRAITDRRPERRRRSGSKTASITSIPAPTSSTRSRKAISSKATEFRRSLPLSLRTLPEAAPTEVPQKRKPPVMRRF